MIPIAHRIARAGRGELAVFRLLNSVRGWDAHRTPVRDAHWALDEIALRLGETTPVCLVGHSLGGRAALLAGEREDVQAVVALAPWLYLADAAGGLAGRRVLFVHGDRDRIASPSRAAKVASGLSPQADVSFVRIAGGRRRDAAPPPPLRRAGGGVRDRRAARRRAAGARLAAASRLASAG